MITTEQLVRATNKALKSGCKYKVAAIGFDKRGQLLGVLTNQPYINRIGGSLHAEVKSIQKLRGIRTLIVVRVNNKGILKPIHPCANCKNYAKRFSVKIKTIK